MNKRIKELAIQSGFSNYDEDEGLYSPYIEGEWLNDELKKFAELIVKECMDKVSKWGTCHIEDNVVHHSNIADDINEDLRKHFGIKE